ncbi:fibrinogen C domain-containing protein 1-like [Anneissia japonica]|uniref:fibrinogen C domain-containing protein 1-like n=1 Tax=Anneissia japonica TaxID=1529436 RepID=UPI001425707D|nr:fibrinogen C domain-containing protein 1-like [Anneissia japonica]XP_033127700.1 fibrinogen C domain-containing protein 1-like [Anneissia japonica]
MSVKMLKNIFFVVSLLSPAAAVGSNATDTFVTFGSGAIVDSSQGIDALSVPQQPFLRTRLGDQQSPNQKVSTQHVLAAVENLSLDIRTQLSECSGGRIRQLEQAVLDLSSVLKVFVNQGQTKVIFKRPKDCTDHLLNGVTQSDVYIIYPDDCGSPFEVYCDMTTDGGGWTVFQRRQDGMETFYRGFGSYRRGFGKLLGEFWLGLDKIRRLTLLDEYELRVDMKDFDSNTAYAKYGRFRIGGLEEDFRLLVEEYSGTAGDAMILHNHQRFSTFDRDNDAWNGGCCAEEYSGAWWYESCHFANLNGVYLHAPGSEYGRGVVWRQWRGYEYSLKFVEMKMRRKN